MTAESYPDHCGAPTQAPHEKGARGWRCYALTLFEMGDCGAVRGAAGGCAAA